MKNKKKKKAKQWRLARRRKKTGKTDGKEKELKEENKASERERARERERESHLCMRFFQELRSQFTWCLVVRHVNDSTKFQAFQFFYYCVIVYN